MSRISIGLSLLLLGRGGPEFLDEHTVVSTGSEIIVWGGLIGTTNAGAIYTP